MTRKTLITTLIVLLLFSGVPVASAQWTDETIHTYGAEVEPLGVALETQPLTGRWNLVYGLQTNTTSAAAIRSAVTETGTFTEGTDTQIRAISQEKATLNVGGISTSMDQLSFCFTDVTQSGGDPTQVSLWLATATGDQMGAGEFDIKRVSTDLLWTVPCDTGQPRNSLSADSGTSIAWVADFDGSNSTRWLRLNSNHDTIHGPVELEGEQFVGVDERMFMVVPGNSFITPSLVRDPEGPDESCPANIFSKLTCLAGKAIGGIINAGSSIINFIKEIYTGAGVQDPTPPTVDVYAMAGSGGRRLVPILQEEISMAGHTFLLQEADQKPLRIIRSTQDLNTFFAGDAIIVDDYTLMNFWYDDQQDVFQVNKGDLFDGPGATRTAFEWPTGGNGHIRNIKMHAFDGDLRQSQTIGGVFVDESNSTVWFFNTRDQGLTWNVTNVANDAFTIGDHTSIGVSNQKTDIAYDRSRDRVIIAYESNTSIQVAHKEFIVIPSAVAGTSDVRGFLDNEGQIQTALREEIAFGINVAPLAESTGFGIFGTKLFLGFLVVAMGVVGMRGATNKPTMCVTLGGGLGLVIAIAMGLMGFWSVTIMLVFLSAAIVLFRRLEGRQQDGVMPAGE